jgi:hypothetical protein
MHTYGKELKAHIKQVHQIKQRDVKMEFTPNRIDFQVKSMNFKMDGKKIKSGALQWKRG